MTTLTKLLPPEAAPAQPILDRAHTLSLTLAERVEWPQEVKVDSDVITFGVTERRVLEVNDVFVDEKGEFWAVRPAVEKILHVTGDLDLMREAAGALINRGVRVAEAEGGFAVVAQENAALLKVEDEVYRRAGYAPHAGVGGVDTELSFCHVVGRRGRRMVDVVVGDNPFGRRKEYLGDIRAGSRRVDVRLDLLRIAYLAREIVVDEINSHLLVSGKRVVLVGKPQFFEFLLSEVRKHRVALV